MNADGFKYNSQTAFEIQSNPYLNLKSSLFFCGSCFSENMGSKLRNLEFEVCINPFGILYDPLSLSKCIDKIHAGMPYSESDLYFLNDKFHALSHHGSYASSTAFYLLEQINKKLTEARLFIQQCDVAIITLGTSFAYFHDTTNQFVGNCHKLPSQQFKKQLLTEKTILESLQTITLKLRDLNPKIKLQFTVSPVKHLRDGIMQNAVSKARLLSAINQFIAVQTDIVPDYFPAFEIMNEELRDHRYYETDLAHPNAWSLEYIFRRFIETRFDDRGKDYVLMYEKYLRMLHHKPMTSNNEELTNWAKQKTKYFEELKKTFSEKQFIGSNNPIYP